MKRKDKNGLILRKGEQQRNDGRYEYRYSDTLGRRKSIYAKTLTELRSAEQQISADLENNLLYSEGNISISELVERYLSTKNGIKESTTAQQYHLLNVLGKDPFCSRPIRSVKTSDVKLWFINLQKEGKKKNTIESYRSVLSPAFQMAVEEDVLAKNPFIFALRSVLKEDAEQRVPLTKEQVSDFLTFCKQDIVLCGYVDMFIIMLGTGVRAGELCALTKSDVDFKRNAVIVSKQICRRKANGNACLFIATPKSKSGCRMIPMTDDVKAAFERTLERRRMWRLEKLVDGIGGFLFITSTGTPRDPDSLDKIFKTAEKRYRKAHPGESIPHITPHVFRHTFCTNMANSGMAVKALQYLMGHANVVTTLNVYAHNDFDHAAEEFDKFKEKLQVGI